MVVDEVIVAGEGRRRGGGRVEERRRRAGGVDHDVGGVVRLSFAPACSRSPCAMVRVLLLLLLLLRTRLETEVRWGRCCVLSLLLCGCAGGSIMGVKGGCSREDKNGQTSKCGAPGAEKRCPRARQQTHEDAARVLLKGARLHSVTGTR